MGSATLTALSLLMTSLIASSIAARLPARLPAPRALVSRGRGFQLQSCVQTGNTCPAGQTLAIASNLYYPTQQNCCVLSQQSPQQLCNYHCRKACAKELGLQSVPNINYVNSVVLSQCTQTGTGTRISVTACCSPPPPTCLDASHTAGRTNYLHYPQQAHSQSFCNSVAANAQQECGAHCENVCENLLGTGASVASVTLHQCQSHTDVAGFNSGTVVKMDVCCSPPTCPSPQMSGTTPPLHYPQQTHSQAFCDSVAADAQNECGFHCKKVCSDLFGAGATVASVTMTECQPHTSVPGFSSGTIVKMQVCCSPPPPTCPDASHTAGRTNYLHYPQQVHSQSFCNSVAANAQQECGAHCENVCENLLGTGASVASVTLHQCQSHTDVTGFSSGTVVKMDVCCSPPTCLSPQMSGTTPPLHYPQQTHSQAFCDSVAADAQNECGFHCKKVCSDLLGAGATVGSVTMTECQSHTNVPGFSSGTIVKMHVCCSPPPPTCTDASQTHGRTNYLHYPQQVHSQSFCNSIAANAQQECGAHCENVCENLLGTGASVASVTLYQCQSHTDVAGFSSGTVVKMDVCCAPPTCPSPQMSGTTPPLHYPQQTHSQAFCDSVAADAQNECGFHCKKVCSDLLGAGATVASVTMTECQSHTNVPGFSSGTIVKMHVCCSPPPLTCQDASHTHGRTNYLHYPQQVHSQSFCNSVAANAQQECGAHCENVCENLLGTGASVASVALYQCQSHTDVAGFSSGTVVKMDVCCAPPTCPSPQMSGTTPPLHYPQQTHSQAFCDSVAADAQNECGFHCKKVCSDLLGAGATVGSVTMTECQSHTNVPGFSSGTIVKMQVCCNP